MLYKPAPDKLSIVYDGDCPFCSRYVAYLRLRESVGKVEMVNARQDPDVVAALHQGGYSLDEGMIVAYGGSVYHGQAAITVLAELSQETDLLRRFNAWILRSRFRARAIYPILRFCRNQTLRVLNRRRIHPGPSNLAQPSVVVAATVDERGDGDAERVLVGTADPERERR